MAGEIDIINEALLSVGGAPIANLQDGPQAVLANLVYPQARRAVLRSHPWNFASRRVTLAAVSTVPTFGFGAQFQLPADFLRCIECVDAERYKVEGRLLLADATSVQLRYVADVPGLGDWDALALQALVTYLGSRFAYPVCRSTEREKQLFDLYAALITQARAVDAQEETSEDWPEEGILIGARY